MLNRNPFVVGILLEMSSKGLTAKEAAALCDVKYHTFMKVIRTGGGKELTKNKIAIGFGYNSWADLFKIGEKHLSPVCSNVSNNGEDIKITLGRYFAKLENRIDELERRVNELTKKQGY